MNTVTVLIEGYIKAIEGRQLIPGVAADGARHVAGTVALIRGEQAVIVADPGMVRDRALIVDALAKEGVSPHEVTHVFVSHHHPDHTVNIALFPNAEVVDFWAVYKGDLWRDHADGYTIAPALPCCAPRAIRKRMRHSWWRPSTARTCSPISGGSTI